MHLCVWSIILQFPKWPIIISYGKVAILCSVLEYVDHTDKHLCKFPYRFLIALFLQLTAFQWLIFQMTLPTPDTIKLHVWHSNSHSAYACLLVAI